MGGRRKENVDDKSYSMHIDFAKKNKKPFVRLGMTRTEYSYEVNRWLMDFNLRHLREEYGMHYFLAKKRRRKKNGNQGSAV
jgi:hypothetical protein